MSNLDNEDLLLVHREGKDYRAKVDDMATDLNINIEIDCSGGGGSGGGGDVDLDGYATEAWVEAKGYITIDEVPESTIEGALVFKGTVANESSLPAEDNSVGDMYHTTEEDALFAWGEDNDWHNVGSAGADVNLDEYARLDGAEFTGNCYWNVDAKGDKYNWFLGSELSLEYDDDDRFVVDNAGISHYGHAWFGGSVTGKEFIGDGSKLTNLPGGGGADLDENSELHIKTLNAGDNIRTNPTGTGVEVNGELGVVHVKPKTDSATAFEVFKPDGSTAQEASSMFRVSPSGDVQIGHTAIELKPDGSATFTRTINTTQDVVGIQGGEIRVYGDYTSTDTGNGGIHLSYDTSDKTSLITAGSNNTSPPNLKFAFVQGGEDPKAEGRTPIQFNYDGSSTFAGSISAKEFIGDGSKLTGVGLPDFRTLTPLT